ncbi:IclR family transcriptional regulator domain-containing protein [Crystallibacter degradans]|uniref:IclR family transcriptional regulator domain-containing protein n=1 Tax=Crystallibacter degradans TaxID=2726743 RepID=UPI0014728DBF|nr:IclR family transcriptional regulator C-terminal domain-containing protein [Arthrobacter sp. SF27]NMR32113.1 helix-turn-helix domain-containing protein [Arthrobacter sp. SF27]
MEPDEKRSQAGFAQARTNLSNSDPGSSVKALDRGLKVLAAISDAGRPSSVSEIALAVGMTRTAARRFILTLEHLGYVASQGQGYVLQPRVLELGEAYLSSQPLAAAAHPHLKELAAAVAETVSLTVLHQGLVTYVDRVQASRILSINIVVGSRVPAYATATGRVLLAGLEEAALVSYFSALQAQCYTANTETDAGEIRKKVFEARDQGWFLADQQFRSGIRSLAVPVKDGRGATLAAINISASASRVTAEDLKNQYLEPLRQTAEEIAAAVTG